MDNYKIIFFMAFLLTGSQVFANNPGQLVNYIQGTGSINCHWVENVGDTNVAPSVQFVESSITCNTDGNSDNTEYMNGLCKGTIRCTGIGNGWGDVYFEDVHCLGNFSFGTLTCGRSGDSNETNRNFSEGVKSCLSNYISNGAQVIEIDNGNKSIRGNTRREAVQ